MVFFGSRFKNPHDFSHLAPDWWHAQGAFRALHAINPLRLSFIRERAQAVFDRPHEAKPLQGLRVLDVGCGGGLASEPLCRMGADVVGLDRCEKAIEVAKNHARLGHLSIDYRQGSIEGLLPVLRGAFDIVVALEVVEHVEDVLVFLKGCIALLRSGGLLVLSTFTRTVLSYLLGIVMAENVLGWAPKGAHEWKKFVHPDELAWMLKKNGMTNSTALGISYDPLGRTWVPTSFVVANYLCGSEKV